MSETLTVCPYCRQRVDPDRLCVEQRDLPGFGQAHDFADGERGFVHEGCLPEAVGYQWRPRPA